MKLFFILFLSLNFFTSCEKYPPIVPSITRGEHPGVNPTNSSQLEFNVTFSESISFSSNLLIISDSFS